jgi:hypothetical protein
MLWAWETPEDFTTLDPTKAGVAFLSRELLLGQSVQIRLRRQPLLLAHDTWLLAVVSVEAAREIVVAAQQPNVRALQVDFDATASQHAFYTAVLQQLRPQLPPNIPLSITALVSWCRDSGWLHLLPIDEAVPMFFRMGGPAAIRAIRPKNAALVREPVCSGSVGISTDETWPAIHSRQRVYVFHPGSWTQRQLAQVNALGYQGLKGNPPQ